MTEDAIKAVGLTKRFGAVTAVDAIDFPDGFCRRDIGWRALR